MYVVLCEWASYVAARKLRPEVINHESGMALQKYPEEHTSVAPTGSSGCNSASSISYELIYIVGMGTLNESCTMHCHAALARIYYDGCVGRLKHTAMDLRASGVMGHPNPTSVVSTEMQSSSTNQQDLISRRPDRQHCAYN